MAANNKSGVQAATASLLVLIMSFAFTNSLMGILLNHMIDEYSLVSVQQGFMNSMVSLGSLLAVLMVPVIQGRVKKTVMLSASALLQAAMLMATGLAPSFFILLTACLFLGLAGGWLDNYTNSCIMDIHKTNSAHYMGMLHGFYGLGAVLTPLLVQALLYSMNWRGTYLVVGSLALGAAVFFLLVARFQRSIFRSTADAEQKLSTQHITRYFKDRYSLLVVMCCFFYSATQSGLLGWMVRYMKIEFQNETLGAISLSVFWLFATISRFFAPRIKAAPMTLISVGFAVSIVAHTAGVLLGNPLLMVVFTAINGLATGHCVPLIIHESVVRHPGMTSTATSISMLVVKLAMMTTPLLMATISSISMQTAMLIPSVCTAGALLFALAAIREGKRHPLPAQDTPH